MKLKEIALLPPGSLVYKIEDTEITSWIYLGPHPAYPEYEGFGAHGNVLKAIYVYSKRGIVPEVWEGDYESAKEEMWKQLMKRVNIINSIYFDGKKQII